MPHGRSEGPSGKLFLFEDYSDSPSGYDETTTKAELSVADGNVVLTVSSEDVRYPSRVVKDSNQIRYAITPDKLVELIQAHGKKL